MLSHFQGLTEKEQYRTMVLNTLFPNATRNIPLLMSTGVIRAIDDRYDRLYGSQKLDGEST